MKPSFLGVGVMKCGTTTLHQYLRRHPNVFVPEIKESDFLKTRNLTPGALTEYEAMFPGGYLAQGEVCPGYIDIPDVIQAHYPDAKIVVMVRDPIERMVSHMRHNWTRTGNSSYLAAMSWDDLIARVRALDTPELAHDVIRLGMYRQRVTPFLERFPHVHVVSTESLMEDFEGAYLAISRFLHVHPFLPNGPLIFHTAEGSKRLALPLTDEQRSFFRDVFADTYDWLRDELKINFP